MKVRIKLLKSNSRLPRKAHDTDAGYDLFVTEVIKKSLFKVHYGLGIATDLPENVYVEIPPRSSIHKKYLWMSNSTGIIDNSYKGEWQAVFYKIPLISTPYKVGEACCQALFKLMQNKNLNFELVDNVGTSVRGSGGFGSTDKLASRQNRGVIDGSGDNR